MVLVVDDDADIREMLVFVLENNHLRVIDAGRGDDALAKARLNPDLSLILLDLRMPGMSGAEVLDRLKHDPALVSLPVIVLSGDRDAQRTATSLGAEGCLMKPISIPALMREVARFVPVPGRAVGP